MDKAKKIRLYYGIALGVLTFVVGILYIVEVAEIYYGVGHFSREIVWDHLILPLVFTGIWAAAIVAGFVLSVVFPVKEKLRALPDNKKTLARLKKRMPAEGKGEDFQQASHMVRYHERMRLLVWACALLLCLAAAVATLFYVFDTAHYSLVSAAGEEINKVINANTLAMLKNVMPWVGVALLGCMGATAYEGFSVKRELGYVKQAVARGGVAAAPAAKPFLAVSERGEEIAVLLIRIAVFAVAVAFIVLGALNGGADDVLNKAIRICTECIGLG